MLTFKIGRPTLCELFKGWGSKFKSSKNFRHIQPSIQRECLFPRRVNRLADHICCIRSRTRSELLHAAVIHFGDVEIPVLVDAESVHSPEAARKISPGSPGVHEVSLEIVLQHLGR